MIPTLFLQTSTPTTIIQVPQQSYVLTTRGSLGRPQEPERKRKGGLWQHQQGRRWRLRKKKREKEGTPSHIKTCTVGRTKTHLYTQRKSTHTLTQYGHMDTVVGLLFLAFDLLQLSVPLEWDSRISASIYVLFHLKTIRLSVIKKGTLPWQVRVGRSLESKLGADEILNKTKLGPTKTALLENGGWCSWTAWR